MKTLQGIFIAPKDITGEALNATFEENSKKFVEAMEERGWILKSPIDFYLSEVPSAHNQTDNHYTMRGNFQYTKEMQEFVFNDVPSRVITQLKKRLGKDRVRVYG